MKKLSPLKMFQLIGTVSGLIGFIFQCFRISGVVSVLAGIFVSFCILMNGIVLLIYIFNQKTILGRENLINRGKKLIEGTQNKIVLFGGDLSWTKDYFTEINKIIENGKKVLVFYPESKKVQAYENMHKLELLGADVISTPEDLGLRCMLVEPDNQEDTIVFLMSKIFDKRDLDKKNASNKYVSEVFHGLEDQVIVNSYRKIYDLICNIVNLPEK